MTVDNVGAETYDAMLGERVRQARKDRRWSLGDMSEMLEEAGAGNIKPGTLARMENGSRPGDPLVWGMMWRILRLPLRELYEGLHLPVPEQLPHGPAAEILQLVEEMPDESKRLTLSFARHASTMLTAALSPAELPLDLRRVAERGDGYRTNAEGAP